MCTYNNDHQKILELRLGAPRPYVAYKALLRKGNTLLSSSGPIRFEWKLGWQHAQGSPTDHLSADDALYFSDNGHLPPHARAEAGAFHLGATLQDAQAWCLAFGSKANVVIKVLVRPEDMIAWGHPNTNYERRDIAARKCYVESLKPVWVRPTREKLREQARKKRAKLAAKLKTKKKRKK